MVIKMTTVDFLFRNSEDSLRKAPKRKNKRISKKTTVRPESTGMNTPIAPREECLITSSREVLKNRRLKVTQMKSSKPWTSTMTRDSHGSSSD